MSKKEKILAVCDVLFVLVLCFAVLLATMLVTSSGGGEEVMEGYTVSVPLLCVVAAAIAGYLIYMVKTSISDLRKMISQAEQEGGSEA